MGDKMTFPIVSVVTTLIETKATIAGRGKNQLALVLEKMADDCDWKIEVTRKNIHEDKEVCDASA